MINLNKSKVLLITIIFFLSACNIISPGIGEPRNSKDSIYVKELNASIPIFEINNSLLNDLNSDYDDKEYRIDTGDVLTVTVWGLNEIFPVQNFGALTNPQNSRTVGSNGEIFFPFVGRIFVKGLTIDEARDKLIGELSSKQFVDPQMDLTITKYNENRKVYLLGEFISPQSIYIGIEDVTITDAIGTARGLNPKTANAKNIFIIRSERGSSTKQNVPVIYKLNLNSSENFLIANNFYLKPKDVVFVSASAFTKWNRIFAQIFPFAPFLNQVGNIQD